MAITADTQPITELDPAVLGERMWDLVIDNRRALTTVRYLPGIVSRYACMRTSKETEDHIRVLQGRHESADDPFQTHVALADGEPRGIATAQVSPEVRLQKLLAPFPPAIARRLPLAVGGLLLHPPMPEYNVNVSAWVDEDLDPEDQATLLRQAYSSVGGVAMSMVKQPRAWTIEPERPRSPESESVHRAIQQAGFETPAGTEPVARYDDQEAVGLSVPPRSALYVFNPAAVMSG
jgi:hypothetical protein